MIKYIPELNEKAFLGKLEKLNRKQRKYGLPVTTAEKRGVAMRKYSYFSDELKRTVSCMVPFAEYGIESLNVIRDGVEMEYIGRRRMLDGVWIASPVDDKYLDEVKRECDTCDHCHTKRRRKAYYLFMDKKGKVVRVGGSCKRDYFGIDAAAVLGFYEELQEYREPSAYDPAEFGGRYPECFPAVKVFRVAEEVTDGFSRYDKGTTVDDVCNALETAFRDGAVCCEAYSGHAMTEEDEEECRRTIARIREYWLAQDSSYAHNVANVLALDDIGQSMPLFVSGIYYGMRRLAEDGNRKEAKPCPYAKGEKVTLDVTVQKITSYESMYGLGYAMKFTTDDGVLYGTFTSGEIHRHSVGDRITIKAVVDEDSEFKGVTCRMLKRVKEAANASA